VVKWQRNTNWSALALGAAWALCIPREGSTFLVCHQREVL
jgi:hypothetical protein